MVMTKFNKRFLYLLCLVVVLLIGSSCKNGSAPDNPEEFQQRRIYDKVSNGVGLTFSDINGVSKNAILNNEYSIGIEILEKLAKNDKYKKLDYIIYFNLALLYAEKTKEEDDDKEKARLFANVIKNLDKGIMSAPEQPLGYLLRSNVYFVMGCVDRSVSDLRSALDSAKGKELVLFEEGVFLSAEKFEEIIFRKLRKIDGNTDNCKLEEIAYPVPRQN